MKQIYNKPYIFLWLSVPFILIIGQNGINESFDINVYDTYYEISNWHVAILVSIFFTFLGLLYWSVLKSGFRPISWLTIVHLICTIDTLFLIWLTLLFNWFSRNNSSLFDGLSDQNLVITICLGLFLLGQLLAVFNFFFTILFKKPITIT